MIYAKTEEGLKIAIFSQKYGVSKKKICEACGINYNTFIAAQVGKTAGYDIFPKINKFIEDYIKNNNVISNRATMTFEEQQRMNEKRDWYESSG